MTDNSNNGSDSIDDKFLNQGDLFGLKYDNGYVFFEVTGWEGYKFAPFDNIGSVDPQSNSGFQRLESDGDDLLHVNRKDKKVLHVGIGQSPASVRRYTNYPEGENRLRTFPNLSVPRPSSGDNFGYVDGGDTPYDEPTDAEELFIPPGVHLDFDFYNPNQNESVEPILNIKAREYNVRALDPRNDGEANAISRIVSPGSPMPIAPVGSMDSQAELRNRAEFDVDPIPKKEIENIRR